MTPSNRSSTFRPDVEGLRGIAVFIVVAFHCGIATFSGGFVGVDVFFVLSGYLITGLLLAEIERSSTIDLLSFYARRIRRLLPASAVMLLVTLVAGALVLAPQELAFASRAARATALYLGNVFFALNSADYFAPDAKSNPLLHMWTLAVEEQFYLFWPLMIVVTWRFRRHRLALAVSLAVVTAASLAASIVLTERGSGFAFYGLHTRAWEFGFGGLACMLPRGAIRIRKAAWIATGWAGFILIVASGCWITAHAHFPGWIALIPVAGTTATLVAGSEWPGLGVGRLLATRPFQIVGSLSYSWYLWHWPFLVFALALLPTLSVPGKAVVALMALAAASVSHRLVEDPIRFHPFLAQRTIPTLLLGASLTVVSLASAFICLDLANRLASSPQMRAITAAVDDSEVMLRQRCVTLGLSADLTSCEFGNSASATEVVLFGDSHAIQWFSPLERIAVRQGWRLTTLLKSGCTATDLPSPRATAGARSPCEAWRAAAFRQIERLQPRLVVLASATNYIGSDRNGIDWPMVTVSALQDATRRTLARLSAAGVPAVVMRDTPLAPFDVPTCLARLARHPWYRGGQCAFLRAAALPAAVYEAERNGALGLSGVTFVDLTAELCGEHDCPAVRASTIIYRDDNHLTGVFATSLVPVLEPQLVQALATP